jgi:hypothetical protein
MTMDDITKHEFGRQLEELSRQNFQNAARMGALSADLTAQRYLLDNIVNQARELYEAQNAAMREVLQMIGPPQTPPPLPRIDEVDAFVGRIAERFRPEPEPHPSDPYDIAGWASARRAAG